MSPAPITTQVGQDLYDALEPLTFADESLGWPLAHYVDALGLILEEIAGMVRTDDEGNDGWSPFADPQRCPDGWRYTLALWAGVRYPRRMGTQELRDYIDGHGPGIWRGTKTAILAAVRRYLTPDGTVYFEERADGNPYALRIFTFGFNTLDEDAIRAELEANVPAGLLLDYEVRVGQTYDMLAGSVETYDEMKTTFPTYDDAYNARPTTGG